MARSTITIGRAFELGLEAHCAGRLADAKRIYMQILAQAPDDPDALQLLGLIGHDQGDHAEAVLLIGRAVAINPSVAEYRNNLGVASGARAGTTRRSRPIAPRSPSSRTTSMPI